MTAAAANDPPRDTEEMSDSELAEYVHDRYGADPIALEFALIFLDPDRVGWVMDYYQGLQSAGALEPVREAQGGRLAMTIAQFEGDISATQQREIAAAYVRGTGSSADPGTLALDASVFPWFQCADERGQRARMISETGGIPAMSPQGLLQTPPEEREHLLEECHYGPAAPEPAPALTVVQGDSPDERDDGLSEGVFRASWRWREAAKDLGAGLVKIGAHPSHHLVALQMLAHAHKDTGEAFPSYSTLSDLTGLSRSTVANAVAWLTEHKVLKRTRAARRDGTPARYVFNPLPKWRS